MKRPRAIWPGPTCLYTDYPRLASRYLKPDLVVDGKLVPGTIWVVSLDDVNTPLVVGSRLDMKALFDQAKAMLER
jgi:hypothetical protein